jgi:phosphatidylserine decarboxylase
MADINTGVMGGADKRIVRALNIKLKEILPQVLSEVIAATALQRKSAPAVRPSKQGHASFTPRAGGVCAAVWGELDKAQADGKVMSLQEVMKLSKRKKWNDNNTRAEYYRWRRAHGITGRLAV